MPRGTIKKNKKKLSGDIFGRCKGNGYIVISMTLILLAVTIGIATTLSFLSSGESKISEASRLGEQSFFWSDGCLEEGLLRLKNDNSYSGGEVSFPDGTCYININTDGEKYTVQSFFSGAGSYQHGIEAEVEVVNGILSVKSWNEKPSVIK
jgi:hypothetical protein